MHVADYGWRRSFGQDDEAEARREAARAASAAQRGLAKPASQSGLMWAAIIGFGALVLLTRGR